MDTRSPRRRCAEEPLPVRERTAKAKPDRGVEAETRVHLVPLASPRTVDSSKMPPRCEDVRRERVLVRVQGGHGSFDFHDRLTQLLECGEKLYGTHVVRLNILPAARQRAHTVRGSIRANALHGLAKQR